MTAMKKSVLKEGQIRLPMMNTVEDVSLDHCHVSGQGLYQIIPKEGQALRMSVLSAVKPKASFYHFANGKFYRCLGGQKRDFHGVCCDKVNKRSWTCVALAVLHENADVDGKLPKERAPHAGQKSGQSIQTT
jgi:hypothetical protein